MEVKRNDGVLRGAEDGIYGGIQCFRGGVGCLNGRVGSHT